MLRRRATVALRGVQSSRAQQRFAGSGSWMSNLMSNVGGPGRRTRVDDDLRQELPEVFERPVEVEDYIRPEKTYFEYLEDAWDWVLSFASPVENRWIGCGACTKWGSLGELCSFCGV